MAEQAIIQHWIFTQFILPFLLTFFIVFGILEKTKLFGKDNKQLNAGIAFVVGLIFVSVLYPKLVVANLILVLTIGLVTMFVGLLLWGFIAGEEGLKLEKAPTPLKWFIGIVIALVVLFGLIWALGLSGIEVGNKIFEVLFKQSWSEMFWTNAAFIVMVIIALVVVLKASKSS